MELKYTTLLEQHSISVSDLPNDAQQNIKEIEKVLTGVKLLEKRSISPRAETIEKLNRLDKYVCADIETYLAGKPKGGTEGDNFGYGDDATGQLIDRELKVAFDSGKTNITFEELKSISKTAHDIIFNSYEAGGQNGIITSEYELIEIDEYVFTLKKNEA